MINKLMFNNISCSPKIMLHKKAKKFFDKHQDYQLPTIQELQTKSKRLKSKSIQFSYRYYDKYRIIWMYQIKKISQSILIYSIENRSNVYKKI